MGMRNGEDEENKEEEDEAHNFMISRAHFHFLNKNKRLNGLNKKGGKNMNFRKKIIIIAINLIERLGRLQLQVLKVY